MNQPHSGRERWIAGGLVLLGASLFLFRRSGGEAPVAPLPVSSVELEQPPPVPPHVWNADSAFLDLSSVTTQSRRQVGVEASLAGLAGPAVALGDGEGFVAHGRVVELARAAQAAQVSARWAGAAPERALARCELAPDGSFELGVPLPEGPPRDFVLRLEAPGFVPDEVEVRGPAPGSRHALAFTCVPGESLEALVLDAVGDPLAGARVELWWRAGVAERWSSAASRSGDDGLARIGEAPRGAAWLRVRAQGHSYLEPFGPYELPRAEDGPIVLRLRAGGRITGRCTRGGEPASDFTVICWEGPGGRSFEARFHDAADGRFVLDHVPLGRLTLVASGADDPPGEPRVVLVEPHRAAQVELELDERALAHGLVLDARSGEPIAGASVQPYLFAGNTMLRAHGEPATAGAGGDFEGLRVGRGIVGLCVRAEGRAPRWLRVGPAREGVLDCGAILLEAPQKLTIVLRGAEELRARSFRVRGDGTTRLPERAFDVDGRVRYEEVAPGDLYLTLVHPDGGRENVFSRLVAGEEWVVELEAGAPRDLVVQLLPPPPGEELPPVWVEAVYRTREGRDVQRSARFDAYGDAELSGLAAQSVVLDLLYAEEGQTVCVLSREVVLEPRGTTFVELEPPARRRALLVEDAAGEALRGAFVLLAREGAPGWFVSGTTDEHGRFPVPLAGETRWIATVKAPDGALALDVAVDFRDTRQARLRLDPAAAIEVELRDGELPLAGVAAVLAGRATGREHDLGHSDLAGRLVWPRVDPASRVELRVGGPELWPVRVDLAPGQGARVVQVRRRGALELRFPAGAPGASLALESLELGAEVGAWIAQGLVGSSSGGLSPDGEGRLRLGGLPHGDYRWSLATPSGETSAGVVRVPPRSVAHLVLDAP